VTYPEGSARRMRLVTSAELSDIQKRLDELGKRSAATDRKTKRLTKDVERVKAAVSEKTEQAAVVQRLLTR